MEFHSLPYEMMYHIVEQIVNTGSLYQCLQLRQLNTLFNHIVQDILFEKGGIFTTRFGNILWKFNRRIVHRSFIRHYLEAFILCRRHELRDVQAVQQQLYEAFLAVHFGLHPLKGSKEAITSIKGPKINSIKPDDHRLTARKLAEMLMLVLGEQTSFQYALKGYVAAFRGKDNLITFEVLTSIKKNERYLWVLATAILSSDLKMFHLYLEHFRTVFGLSDGDEEMTAPQDSSSPEKSEADWNNILHFCLLLSLREPTDTVITMRTLTIDREVFTNRLVAGDNEDPVPHSFYLHIVRALQIQHRPTRHVTLQLLLGFSSVWRKPNIVYGILGEAARVNDCHFIDLVTKSIRDRGCHDTAWESTQSYRDYRLTRKYPFPYDRANAMVVCIHYEHWEFWERLLENSKQLGPALHRYSGEDEQIALRFWIASKPSIKELHIVQKMLLMFGQDCLGIELGWIAAHHPPETLAAFVTNIDLERPCCSYSADRSLEPRYEPASCFMHFELWNITHIVHAQFPIVDSHQRVVECSPSSISIGQCMLVMAIRHLQLENARLLVEDYSVRLPTDFKCPGVVHERNEENEVKLWQLKTMLMRNKISLLARFQRAGERRFPAW